MVQHQDGTLDVGSSVGHFTQSQNRGDLWMISGCSSPKKGRTARIRRQLDPFAYGMRMRMRLAITAGKPEAIEGEVHQTVEDCPSTCPCPCRFEGLSAWENAVTMVRPDPRFSQS